MHSHFNSKEPAGCPPVAAPNFLSQHQGRWVPFVLHPLQHLLFVEFPSMAILAGVKLYLLEVLICISLIFGDADIFTCDFLKTV